MQLIEGCYTILLLGINGHEFSWHGSEIYIRNCCGLRKIETWLKFISFPLKTLLFSYVKYSLLSQHWFYDWFIQMMFPLCVIQFNILQIKATVKAKWGGWSWGGTEQSVSLRYILSDNMIHDDDSEHYLNIQTFQQQLRGERRSKEAKNVNKILPRQWLIRKYTRIFHLIGANW